MNEHTVLDDMVYCEYCSSGMLWEDCDVCGGEGGSSPYEYSPIEYDPDDWDVCDQCRGKGGWWMCINAGCRD